MASSLSASEHLLRTGIDHSLRNFQEANALFLAQLLHTSYPSATSANLLASVHIRLGNFSQAAHALHPPRTSENRYLYAICLTRISTPTALRDAEMYLRGVHPPIDVDHAHPHTTPGGADGLYLLATICQQTGRKDEAISLYRKAAKENPTLWVAVEALSNMGIVVNVDTILPKQTDAEARMRVLSQPKCDSQPFEQNTPRIGKNPAREPPSRASTVTAVHPHTNPSSMRTPQDQSYITPSPMPTKNQNKTYGELCTPAAPQAGRGPGRRLQRRSQSPASSAINGFRIARRVRSGLDDSSVRNPSDLFAPSPDRDVTTPIYSARIDRPTSNVADVRLPENGHMSVERWYSTKEEDRIGTPAPGGQVELLAGMDLIRTLGQIFAELGRFRCSRVIELTDTLPSAHRNSALILSLRGKAFLEQSDYSSAEAEFKRSLFVEPKRMHCVVDYYSTVLWHLKRDKELAQLAAAAQDTHPVTASAWCAAGNCFSLQQDPDTALKFFKKAIRISLTPNAYAYTLCGHEYLAKEDFDGALAAYREALHIDERHYNAMYGIGQVFKKQEKYSLAQNHFRSAVLVNPRNAMLHYHLGLSLSASACAAAGAECAPRSAKNAFVSALAELETAANLDPRNPVPRFERARLLLMMNRVRDAKEQLEDLRASLPKEAEVHYELSRVYQELGEPSRALRSLSKALDIEPKHRKYKKALDSLSNELEKPREIAAS